METILQIKNLNKSFGGLHAVNNVSFDVVKDDINAVIGPNGAGKTTLFNLISGEIKPDSGEIIYNERSIMNYPPYKIAPLGIARTFQNIKLFSGMTVLENVMIGRHVRSKSGFFAGMMNFPSTWKEEKEIKESSYELLKTMGLDEFAEQDALSLAFGNQRLLEISRALALEPDFLLLDEPAAGLNIYETAEMAETISKIKESGITILIIEHDMSLIMDISDRIVVLSSGEKIAQGTPEEIQKNRDVIKIYLGEDDA